MKEGAYRIWSVVIQAVTVAGIIYGIVSGLGSWEKSLKLEEVRLQNELLSAFWAERIEAHIDAAAAAAILARADRDDATWQTAETAFWELYQGRLVVVEDGKVCGAMVRFGRLLTKYEDQIVTEDDLEKVTQADEDDLEKVTQADLKKEALNLAAVIQDSLRTASEEREAIPEDQACS